MAVEFSKFIKRKVYEFIGQEGETGQLPSDATQERFAQKVKLNTGTLSRLIHGRNNPGYQTLGKLVKAPEVGAEALTALEILPADIDPAAIELLNMVIQKKITVAEAHRYLDNAEAVFPNDGKEVERVDAKS